MTRKEFNLQSFMAVVMGIALILVCAWIIY